MTTNDGDGWLNAAARNVTSQAGEDGIIARALEVLPERTQWCVEFGAWDGKHLSNTWDLVQNRDYAAVLIEGEGARVGDIARTYPGNDKVIAVNAWVGFREADGLDSILARTPIPLEFDVLSIDIDGNDWHVWSAVRRYRPKLVVIEHNPTIATEVDFVQPADPRVMQGCSLAALVRLGKEKGYELVATTRFNAIFVDASYFPLFGIADNSPAKLRVDNSLVTHIFCGYDGRVFLRGSCRMPWHGLPYSEAAVQQLPRFLQDWALEYGVIRTKMFGIYKRARKFGLA